MAAGTGQIGRVVGQGVLMTRPREMGRKAVVRGGFDAHQKRRAIATGRQLEGQYSQGAGWDQNAVLLVEGE